MFSDLKVSVIIPVYNAAKYINNAVESAVGLANVGEIILVEDGSPDNALEICRQLTKKYSKIRLLTHPNGENRGAGASRNLGLRNANFDFISFLDADDYYLPNRFTAAERILCEHEDVDGVYDAVGIDCYDQPHAGRKSDQITTIKSRPSGFRLFETLLDPGSGHFNTDGIVIKKDIIEKAGYFNVELRLHQDTDLWIRLCYFGNIVPGETDAPVAMRGVHSENRIKTRSYESKAMLYRSLFRFFLDRPVSSRSAYLLLRNYVLFNKKRFQNGLLNKISDLYFLVVTLLRYPKYILKLLGNG